MFPQSALIAFLLPLGLWLILVASAQRPLEPRAAAAGLIALTVSALVYLAVGFGIMFGGVGALGGQRQYAELSAYFALPVDGVWAIAGMKGFFLEGVSGGRALFVAWLPLAQACAALVAVPLWRRYSLFAIGVAAALATLAFSAVGMATWGGGVGAALASQLRLGHGPVDFGGLGIAGLIGGVFSLLALRRRAGETTRLHESPNPLRSALGLALAVIGAAGVLAANPLTGLTQAAVSDFAIVIASATATACLSSLGYTLFVSRRPNIETVTASMLAALIAVSAGAMSLPLWAALLLGIFSALSVILGGFLWNGKVDGAESSPGVPRMLIPAAMGLLSAGIASTGVYGAGLNGIGPEAYLGTRGLGVSGLFGAASGVADPGQVTAQIAIVILGAGVAIVLGLPMRLFTAAEKIAETAPEAAAIEAPTEAFVQASAPEAAVDLPGEPVPVEVEAAHPLVKPAPPPAVTAAQEQVSAPATSPTHVASVPEPVAAPTLAVTPAPPPKTAPSAVAPASPAARAPDLRAPSLLERLRGNRPTEKPKPVGQARRVAYPVRVGGRRLILRAMPPESKPAEEAKDADQP